MIDIRFGYLFPWPIRLAAFFGLIAAFGILQPYLVWAIVLFLASVLVLSCAEGTEVNINDKTFREYTSYFFIKAGKFNSFSPVEKIYITQGKESQRVYTAHTNHSSTFENVVHNGYLKFSTGEKIHLLREKHKDKLVQKLTPLSHGLHVEIVDHS
ncbi:MAG TPA: hypothetical protein VGK39_00600 [Cyclobacteriaceae bacterium]